MEDEELQGVGTTEDIKKQEEILMAKARRKTLEKNLENSIFGTNSASINFKGINYASSDVAGGSFGKAAEQGDWSKWSMPDDMAYKAFQQQEIGDLIIDTLAGGSKLAVAGFLDMAASWDLAEVSNTAQGNAMAETGNWLQQQADKLQSSAQQKNTIYQDGDNMWTAAYWANQGQQLGYSAGIVGEIVAEQAILALATGGSGNIAGLASKARFLKPLLTQGAMGLAGGMREAYMNARETQENVYSKFIQNGFTEEEAKAKADEAAHISFKTEAGSLVVLNTLQNMFLFGGMGKMKAFNRGATPQLQMGFSSFGEQLLEKVLPQTTSKAGRRAIQYGLVPAVTEGMEEGIQSLSQQWGEYSVGDKEGKFDPVNTELRDSVIGGALGGILLGAGAKAISKFNNYLSDNQFSKEYKNFIDTAVDRTANTFIEQEKIKKEYQEAQIAYNKNKTQSNLEELNKAEHAVKQAKYNSHLTNAVNALQYDYIKGEGTQAFDAHIGQMQSVFDAVKNKDTEALRKHGLIMANGKERFSGSFETILNTFEQNIKDSEFIKQSLSNNLENVTTDFESAFDITKKEYTNSKYLEEISELEGQLAQAQMLDTYVSQLSTNGKTRFNLENELAALEQVEKDKDTKRLSREDQQRKKEIEEQLSELKYTDRDKKIIPNTNRKGYINAEVSKISLGQAIDQNNLELNSLKDSNKITEKIKDRAKKKLKKAKTKDTIAEAQQEAEQAGVADENFNKEVENKIKEVDNKDKISNLDSTGQTVSRPVQTKPKENSKEAEPDSAALFSAFLKEGRISTAPNAEEDISNQAFSRQRVPNEQITDDLKDKANLFVKRKSQQLGKDVNLEDVIVDSIERNGLKNTEDVFQGIVALMETAGKDVSESNSLYYKYFEDDLNVFKSFTVEEADTTVNTVEKQAQQNTEFKDKFNVNGQPISAPVVERDYEDTRTNKSKPKIAFNFQEYERDGFIFTITSDKLKGDNHYILDSEFVNSGDRLLVEVINDDSQPISSFSPTGTVVTTTWGEYKKTIEPNSQAYINRIPMGIYKEVGDTKVLVGHVHDSTWYIPNNISEVNGKDEQERIAKEGYNNTVEVRKAILENGGSGYIEISRQFGALDKINKSKDTTPISIAKATGETTIARIVEGNAGTIHLETQKGIPLDVVLEGDLQATNNGKRIFNPGGIADVRYAYTQPDGTKVYMALPVMQKKSNAPNALREDLNPTIFNSLKYATLANIVLNNTNNSDVLKEIEKEFSFTVADAKDIQSKINSNLRVDIKSNLNGYMEFFVRMSNGSIVLDDKRKPSIKDLQSEYNIGKFRYLFGDNGVVLKSSFNVNYNKLNASTLENVYIPTINEQGKVEEKFKGYNDLVKNNTFTNVRSHQITKHDGTKQWIIDVHPLITYNLIDSVPTTSSAQRAVDEASQEMEINTTLNISQDVLEGMSAEDIALLESLNRTMNQNNLFNSRRILSGNEVSNIDNTIVDGRVELLTDPEFREMVDSLKHRFISSLDFNEKITIGNLKTKLESLVDTEIQPIIEVYKERFEKFSKIPALEPFNIELQSRIDKLESTIAQKDKITGSNGILLKELNKLFGFNLEEEYSGEEEFDSSNNFRKSFLEKDIKLSYSNKLTMSFFGIKQLKDNSNQEVINDLTGLPAYESPDYVELILKSITTEIPSNWNTLMDKLQTKYNQTNKPIYNQLRNNLKDLPQNLKNEILYKLISSRFTAHKIILSVQKGKAGNPDKYVLTVIDENSSKENIKLKKQTRDNFKSSSPLTMVDVKTNEKILNLEQALKYQLAFNKHIKENTFKDGYTKENATLLKSIFNAIGLNLSDNTIKEYLQYNDPFNNTKGLLSFVSKQLDKLISKAKHNKVVVTDEGNNLFDTANKALNDIIELEIALNGTNVAKSIRVGGKTLQGTIQNTSAFDTLRELKEQDSQLLDKLLSIGYTKDSLILNQLRENPQVADILFLSFSSPDSYKVNGKKNYSDTEYDKLSDTDGLISMLGLYTNERGNVKLNNADDIRLGLSFRVGEMPFMTLSDKGRMLYMKTIMLDGKDEQFVSKGETIEISDDIMDLLFQQVFESDYNRILDAYANEDPHVKSFSEGSKIFTFLPIFNTLKVDGVNIHDILKERIKNGEALPSINTFRGEAIKMLSGYINSEVDQKLDANGNGIITDSNLYVDGKLLNIDTKYLSKFEGTPLVKGRKLFAEHAVNNLLHQVSLYQIFLGDMAYYTKFKGVLDADGFVRSDVIEQEYLNIAETIGQVVDKRSASLIAPGFTLANASDTENKNSKYMQLQILDVNSISSIIEPLIRAIKDELTKEELNALEVIKNPNSTKQQILSAYEVLEENNEELSAYFNIEGTDAQEYNTWKTHIDILFRQGNLTGEERDLLSSAYTKLSEGKFDEVSKEETKVVMQPIKPVYTGMVPLYNKEGKVISMRPVYIKSSSFPLLPHITKNLKIDNLRKNLEALEESSGMTVKASYQTANKIGANKTMLTTEDLYTKSFEELSQEVRDGRNVLESATLMLDTKNFKIQQETPDKVAKFLAKNQDNYISMGSQFWKVILGNGINKMTDRIFPNKFSKDLLDAVGIENTEMLSGEDLDKINFYVFSNFSKAKSTLLYNRLGLDRNIPFANLTKKEKKTALENVINILKEEVTSRNYPEYLTESLNLITDEQGNVTLESPIFLDSNANKFESLLLSLVANSSIFHKLPGLGHISTSSEGFEKVSNLEELSSTDRQGIVWFDKPTGRLKSTMLDDNTISESEVLIKSHFRRTRKDENGNKVTELIDFTSDTYSEAIIEDGKVVGRKLKLDMIDEELLLQFSFRIPTSSHQSGVILKVVGFLPPEAGDMLLVPAEHTVQLGEDYDIDKRYIYKSNYIFDGDRIAKLDYKKDLRDKNEFDRLYEALLGDDVQESDKDLKVKIKMYENAMIDIYKAVYQSPSKAVQQKIFKPLSVGVAKETAFLMDSKLNEDKQPYFSSLSDTYQRKLLKAGADGKGGIGVHSNAVTLEAQMQRLSEDNKLQLRHAERDEDGNVRYVPTVETIGPLVSDSNLGASEGFKSIDGRRDVADQHGENQNVSTDNINEQIMSKRNENSYTMSVYALMASRGFDLSEDNVVQNNNKPMHIPSLFINQPIIRDYVKMKSQQDSISGEFIADKDSDILNRLVRKYGGSVPRGATISNFLRDSIYMEGSRQMTGQALYDSLSEEIALKNNTMQLAVLQKFAKFRDESRQLSEVQQLISLSTSGLGVSYFETLQRIKMLDNLPFSDIKNAYKLIGDYQTSAEYLDIQPGEDIKSSSQLEREGYTRIGNLHWKPETIEGVMLIDSLKAAQDLMDIFFPYKDAAINGVIEKITSEKDIDLSKKSKTVLEQQYEIMRELKSFMNTYSNSQYFKGNINEERRRLFIDSEDNTSLANIIKDIQDKKLPLSNNPFIRNLIPQIQAITEPSLLLYNNTDSTSLDSYTEYDAFGRLLLDDTTVLGEYNGESITPRKLAQDLVSYAMLADSQNGATGFDTLVPIKYLQIIGYNTAINNNYAAVKNNPDMLNNFIEQYFQHNPERTNILSSSTIDPRDIITNDEDINKKLEALAVKKEAGEQVNLNFLLQELKSFSLVDDTEFGNYIAIRNPKINNSDNKFNLFKYNPETTRYEQIPTLGTTGMKEYNAEVFQQSSILPVLEPVTKTNKANKYFDLGNQAYTAIPEIQAMLPANEGVRGILERYLNSVNTDDKTKEFISNLLEYGDLDAKIVYTPPAYSALGQYNPDTNEIYIHPGIFDRLLSNNPNLNEVRDVVREVLLEEIIHSMTIKEFDKYVKSSNPTTGEVILVDNPPLFATKLVSLYQAAKESLPYNPSNNTSYYSQNIYEFMAGMFIAEDYRKALEEANPGIVQKFLEALRDMLGNLYKSVTGRTLSYQDETFNAVYDLLKAKNVKSNVAFVNAFDNNPMDQMIKNDTISNTINNTVNIETFTNHSGGAIGADTQWDIIGREFGMINNKHYYFEGFKTPNGNTPISISLKNEADSKLIAANRTLQRRFPTSKEFVNNLLRRNWWQVKNSDAIFAISSITNNKVNGGTGWAVHMGIAENKPVYVFDQIVGKWFTWSNNQFVETQTPRLTPNFAGIGTREINDKGKQAIRDVYNKTISQNSTLDSRNRLPEIKNCK